MHIKPEIGTATGPVNESHWGQGLMTPQAYGVLEIADPNGRSRELGISVLTHVSELLSPPPSSLDAVSEIAKQAAKDSVASMILLVPVGMVTYIVLFGSGAVYLKRDGTLSCLLSGQGAISGEVQMGDTILLVSHSFTQIFSQEELASVFDHLSPQDAAEKLTLMLHEKTGGEGSAGLIFQITDTEAIEEEEPPIKARELAKMQPLETLWRQGQELGLRMKQKLPDGAIRRMRRVRGAMPTFATRKSKFLFIVTVLLFSLFSVSVVLGITKQGFSRVNSDATKAQVEAQHAFDEGVALLDLNPVKGRERLSQAKTILEPFMKTVSTRSKQGREIAALYQQILDNLTQAMHAVKGEPKLFYDASLLKKGSLVTQMAIEGDTIAMVDKTLATVYTLTVPTRSSAIIAGGDGFSGTRLVTIHGTEAYVFTDNGIHQVDTTTKTTTQSVIKKDETWGEIAAISSYGGNLYLLDNAKGRIWKYMATSSGFSERKEYLNPDTLPNLSHTTGMVIDGSVYAGTTAGKILRFTQGQEHTFVASGVEPALGNDLVVWTSDEAKNIYVLDTQNKRVVVLDKDGVYLAQYLWEGSIVPTQLVVSEKSNIILLLADGKIYFLTLK